MHFKKVLLKKKGTIIIVMEYSRTFSYMTNTPLWLPGSSL